MSRSSYSQPFPCVAIIGDEDGLPFNAPAGMWRTLIQLYGPSNIAVQLTELSLSLAGTVVTDPPVLIQLVRQIDTGSKITEVYPSQEHDAQGMPGTDHYRPIQTQVRTNIIMPPTTREILRSFALHPQHGTIYPYRQRLDSVRPLTMAPEHRLAIRMYAEDVVGVTGYLLFSEGSTRL